MSTTQLTPAQHAILAKAINTSGGKIEWFRVRTWQAFRWKTLLML